MKKQTIGSLACSFLLLAASGVSAGAASTTVDAMAGPAPPPAPASRQVDMTPPQQVPRQPLTYAHSIAALQQHGGADALFTAALLGRFGSQPLPPTRRLQLLDQAARLAPGDAAIAAKALAVCVDVDSCHVAAHAQRLHLAAPGDASFLAHRIQPAQADNQPAAVTAVLMQMAAFGTLHDYWLEISRHLVHGLSEVDARPWKYPTMAVPHELGWQVLSRLVASTALPGYFGDIAKACNPDRAKAAFAPRREACGTIGSMMQHSGTLITNLIGLRLIEWAASNDLQRQAARESRRRIRWQMNLYAAVTATGKPLANMRAAAALYRAQQAAGSEIGGLAAELQRLNQPLEPPRNWHSRAWHLRHDSAPESNAKAGH